LVENTHEPIVDKETFQLAARRCKQRTCQKLGVFNNVFSGIAKCADCGRNMSTVSTRKKDSPANLACGGYKLYGSGDCSNHFIDYNVLYDIVQSMMIEQMRMTNEDKYEILGDIRQESENNQNGVMKQKELIQLKKRNRELDRIIEKLYEDNINGMIKNDRMKKLLDRYEAEAADNAGRIQMIEQPAIDQSNDKDKSFNLYKKMLDEYVEVKELTSELLFKLIDRIEISQGHFEKSDHGRIKHQTVKIYFRFAGNNLTKEFIA